MQIAMDFGSENLQEHTGRDGSRSGRSAQSSAQSERDFSSVGCSTGVIRPIRDSTHAI